MLFDVWEHLLYSKASELGILKVFFGRNFLAVCYLLENSPDIVNSNRLR
jgi:hypothetical protein